MVKTYLECECVFVLGVPNITDLLVGIVNSNFKVTWDFDDGGCSVSEFTLSFMEEGMVNSTFSISITDFDEDGVQFTTSENDMLRKELNYTVTVTGVNAVGVSEVASFFYFPGTYMYVGSADPFIPYISENCKYVHS